jgi:hypothetical protein
VSTVCGNPYSVGIKELKAAERISGDVLEGAVPGEREGRVSDVPGLRFQNSANQKLAVFPLKVSSKPRRGGKYI